MEHIAQYRGRFNEAVDALVETLDDFAFFDDCDDAETRFRCEMNEDPDPWAVVERWIIGEPDVESLADHILLPRLNLHDAFRDLGEAERRDLASRNYTFSLTPSALALA